MTAVINNDSFFDSDGENENSKANSPYLKGAYDRGNSSPATEAGQQRAIKNKSLTPSTSGNFSAKSSDSVMSDKGGARSYRYDDSPLRPRSRSPSPYRSPYTRSPAYSDSFNSEDSDQDSRRVSPERTRRQPSGKPKGKARGGYSGTTSSDRFNSGTSQDSQSTHRSYGGSSNYGKNNRTNKKAFQKTPLKKPAAANNNTATTNKHDKRSNSIASSQTSPRNTNEVTRRMLSAKGHTISRLRNEFNQLQKEHDEAVRENKLLKMLQRRQERALAKFDSEESELPQLLQKHSAELDSMRRRIRKYQERDKDKDRRMKDKDEQFLRTEDELKSIKAVAEDKGLLDRHDLQKRINRLEARLANRDKKLGEMESYVKHMKKNQQHELHERQGKEEEMKGRMQSLERDNERLQMQLREREKELEVRNIYSNRLIKPPGKLRHNFSPTSLKPIMVSKATSTADQPKVPRPPLEREQRECSAEEVRRREETAARVKSPKDVTMKETKKTEEKTEERKPEEQTRELSEHEKILRDLDMGWEKRDGGSDAADARRRQEYERRKQQEAAERRKEEEERQQRELDEMQRREEEDRRRRREAEEAEAKRKLEEEEKHPSVHKRPRFYFPSQMPLVPSTNQVSWTPVPPKNPNTHSRNTKLTQTATNPVSSTQHPRPKHSCPNPIFASTTPEKQYTKPSSFNSNSNPKSNFVDDNDDDDDDFFNTQSQTANVPAWLQGNSNTTEVENERKKKAALQDARYSPKFDNSPNNNDDDEENVPFFGSKPAETQKPVATKSPPYAVNSVRDLRMYSRGDNNEVPKQGRDEGGTDRFGQNQETDANKAEQQKEAERIDEERHKKDLLLARMQEIDDGKKPDSGKSRKNYNFSRPVENLHNGIPSHPDDDSANGKEKKYDTMTFGSYAPTFSSGKVQQKPKKKSFFDDDDDDDSGDLFSKMKPAAQQDNADKKTNLMADLFGNNAASEEKATKSSFNDDKNVFTSSTKAKPVSYPWEKKVDVGHGTNATNGHKGHAASKAPGNMSHDSLDDIDDLEEVIL